MSEFPFIIEFNTRPQLLQRNARKHSIRMFVYGILKE